jgi:hypothetical protein
MAKESKVAGERSGGKEGGGRYGARVTQLLDETREHMIVTFHISNRTVM